MLSCVLLLVCFAALLTPASSFKLFDIFSSDSKGSPPPPPRHIHHPRPHPYVANPIADENAAHIFNAIHSSMRQWGSSLNHNGMSFFLGHIPAGIELFHGRGDNETVQGLEWLAFEPEHALNFAHSIERVPDDPGNGGPPGKPHDDDDDKDGERMDALLTAAEEHELSTKWIVHAEPDLFLSEPAQEKPQDHASFQPLVTHADQSQHTFKDDNDNDRRGPGRPRWRAKPGYLHTFRTAHPLRIIYIDGMSAGKSDKGTMDSQDFVLQVHDPTTNGPAKPNRPFNDDVRSDWVCNILAAKHWGGRIDGFVRMEHGFELILCDFQKSLETVQISMANAEDWQTSNNATGTWGDGYEIAFWKAITARYDGIGGQPRRVELDYEHGMVSGWEYANEAELLGTNQTEDGSDGEKKGEEERMPRLKNLSRAQREKMFDDLDKIVSHLPPPPPPHAHIKGHHHPPPLRPPPPHSPSNYFPEGSLHPHHHKPTDWQAITDLILTRYSDRLHRLTLSSAYPTPLAHDIEVSLLLRPFIDYSNRNLTHEHILCTHHFLPPLSSYPASLASNAITLISSQICSTLFSSLENSTSLDQKTLLIKHLTASLQWTSWKQCRPGCDYDQVCFTAIWPFGSLEDHLRPSCQNGAEIGNSEGKDRYWGRGPGGPPPGKENDTWKG